MRDSEQSIGVAQRDRLAVHHCGARFALQRQRSRRKLCSHEQPQRKSMSSIGAAPQVKLEARAINPSFTVNDLQQSLAFYVDGFGFEIERQSENEGKVVFAMLKAGNARLGIGQDNFAKGRDRTKGVGLRNWINTDQDLNALAERAKRAGIA
jgi:predicted enzyme related to lactoylglutathione lyase